MKNSNASSDGEEQKSSSATSHVVLSYADDMGTPVLDAITGLLMHWRLFLGSMVFCGLLATGASFVVAKEYYVEGVYRFEDAVNGGGALQGIQQRLGGLASLVGVDVGQGGGRQVEIVAALRSQTFLQEFIGKHGLMQELYEDIQWGNSRVLEDENVDVPSTEDAYRYLSTEILSVDDKKNAGLLTISMKWADANEAVKWIEMLVADLNENLRQDALGRAESAEKYLQQELGKTSNVDLRLALYSLMETQAQQKMLATVSPDYALRAVSPPSAPGLNQYDSPAHVLWGFMGVITGILLGVAWLAFGWVRASASRA